ncbi:PfkB family carbohydrate kinase [Streptomyces lushanensis]|uniref:PfkB family carbohydrate kinase n=1 Tax=Streptomyces lushanensis TaxID=1434255 RepID=UPI000833CCC4|nr:PfkB family carbohydrate kinase [Streptomyces lushanensis]
MPRPHLVAVGDTLADIVVAVSPRVCERLGVGPGSAAFVGLAELDATVSELTGAGETAVLSAGGSAANTCAAFAADGGRATLLTASVDDGRGRAVRDDLSARGVAVPLEPAPTGATGRCLVLLLPDGDRAFLLWQGEPWRLRMLHDGMEAAFAGGLRCDGLLVEGYLLATEDGLEVGSAAVRRATALGASPVLSLSDSALVAARRRRFERLLADGVGTVIGNEAEVTAFTGAADAEEAAAGLARSGVLAVVTLGSRGALVHGPAGRHTVAGSGAPVASALGAGDAFAAGFLTGLLSGLPDPECLALGSAKARAVLNVRQARAPVGQPVGGT